MQSLPPVRRRYLAALALAALLAAPFAPLVSQAAPGARERETPILVLYANGGDESGEAADYPGEVARETRDILSAQGGLAKVRVEEARGASELLNRVRATRSPVLVLVAHGDAQGLRAGDETVTWPEVRAALAASGAREIFLGACNSADVGEVPGKNVHTTFEGLVDYRFVAPTIANDLFENVLTELDAEFVPRFLEYVDERGGLEAYARLSLFPEKTLNAQNGSPSGCSEAVTRWFQGEHVSSPEQCIVYFDSDALNCHNEADRQGEHCPNFAPQDQDRKNQESVPSSETAWGPEDSEMGAAHASGDSAGINSGPQSRSSSSSSPAWFDRLLRALQINPMKNSDLPGGIYVQFGPSKKDRCATIVTIQDIMSGGTTVILRNFLKALKELVKVMAGSSVMPMGEASIALRLCADYSVKLPSVRDETTMHVSAEGSLDIRASGRSFFTWEVQVWRWTARIDIGFEGGVKYPIRAKLDGDLKVCDFKATPYGASVKWEGKFNVPMQVGSAEIFGYALAGYKEFGFALGYGADGSPSFWFARWCDGRIDGGAGTAPRSNAAGPSLPPNATPFGLVEALDPTYARLVSAGAAVVNANPTVLDIREDGTFAGIQAAFVTLRPGHGDFNRFAQTGVLARLGVPADLPATKVVVLDMTNRFVLEALGEPLPPVDVVPEISLVGNGVLVAPASLPVSPALESFCVNEPGKYGAIEAATCSKLVLAPVQLLPGGSATTSSVNCPPLKTDQDYVGVGRSQDESENVSANGGFGSASLCFDSEGLFKANEALAPTTSQIGCAAPTLEPHCTYAKEVTGIGAIATYLGLASEIHEAYQILDRPANAAWLLTKCSDAAVFGQNPQDYRRLAFESIGWDNLGGKDLGICMEVSNVLGVEIIDPQTVVNQHAQGLMILQFMATSQGTLTSQNPGPPPGQIPDVGKLVCDQVTLC